MPSVSVEPGAIPFTSTPCGPSSSAIAFVRFTTPAFAATNAHCNRSGTNPAIDAMLMIRPRFCSRMTTAAALLISYSPVRSTARMRSHSSRGNASMVTRCAIVFTPALFTKMSSRPLSDVMYCTAHVTSSGLVTSSASAQPLGVADAAACASLRARSV